MTPTRRLALLFDLDGTLVDSVELILSAFRHTCRAHLECVPPDSEWIAGLGKPLVTQLRDYAPNDDVLGCMVETYRDYQREHHDRLLRSFEGTAETLRTLRERGHPMGVVTSKIVELARRALAFTGIEPLIDVVVGCDSCDRHKPDPEPVYVALRALRYEPEEALLVGDSPHDIAAGNAAGVITVAALWGPFSLAELENARPAHIIARITDLPELVQNFEGRVVRSR